MTSSRTVWSSLAVTFVASLTLTSCNATARSDAPAEVARRSSVAIEARGCGPQPDIGTGAVVGDGLVVTAAHVVAGAGTVTVSDAAGNHADATVVWFDPEQDVAAVRLDDPGVLASSPADVLVAGADDGTAGAIAVVDADADDGVIVRTVEVLRSVTIETTDIHRGGEVRRPGYEIAGAVDTGDSGALVHVDGGAIGIVWARSTQRDDRAWVVALPRQLTEQSRRVELDAAVPTGACID